MDRIILHSDCNNFFASVECALNPELKNVPLAVAGDKESRRGIILAKNELAKKYKVQTAEPIWQAKKKCPDLVTVPPHHSLYKEYSDRINKIYVDYTDQVERFSIDESWLDVTGSTRLFGDGKTIADTIRKRVREEIGITVSIGVSFNKVFAKLGSDYKKPDATTVISRENYKEILYPLPVSTMLFVGKRSYESLLRLNIKTIGDLAAADAQLLEKKLGKTALMLIKYANGEDDEPVMPYYFEHEAKSIGKGLTFSRNLVGRDDIAKGVRALSDNIAAQMRQKNLKCNTVQVHIKDVNLKTISRQTTLYKPTYLAKEIFDEAMRLILENWSMDKPIRMITVTGTNFIGSDIGGQISLFDDFSDEEKHEKLELAIDKIRSTYGTDSITSASILGNDLGIGYKKD
ncbi:MAG: DNA polymerase IV [Clostridia bacterium]|nr:DNA polymerase IV [Clostridia bacterium]